MTSGVTQRFLETAEPILRREHIPAWGVCRLDSLSQLLPCRGKSKLPPSGSVFIMALPYYTGEFPGRNLSRYAVCDDYHTVAGAILKELEDALGESFPGASFVSFVDSSPIPEVEAGCRAGLGWRGRNGQLFIPEYGSAVFLCEVVTDLMLEPSLPKEGDFCGDCRQCLELCPTGALPEQPFRKELCRSHITQKKGGLSDWETEQVKRGRLAWGCDICTFGCPRNRGIPVTPIEGLRKNLVPVLTAEQLDSLILVKSYGWRGKKVLERNLELLRETEPSAKKREQNKEETAWKD